MESWSIVFVGNHFFLTQWRHKQSLHIVSIYAQASPSCLPKINKSTERHSRVHYYSHSLFPPFKAVHCSMHDFMSPQLGLGMSESWVVCLFKGDYGILGSWEQGLQSWWECPPPSNVTEFFAGSPVFPPSTKPNIVKFQFDQDRGPAWKPAKADVASILNIVIYLICIHVDFYLQSKLLALGLVVLILVV